MLWPRSSLLVALAVGLAGCGSSAATSAPATPTPVPTPAAVRPDCSQPYTAAATTTGAIVGTASSIGLAGKQPLPSANIGLFPPGQPSPTQTTAADSGGRFSFIAAPGSYVVAVIVGPGQGQPEPVTVDVGATCTTTVNLLVNTAPGAQNTTPPPTPTPANSSAPTTASPTP